MIERRTFLGLAALGLADLVAGGPISCASQPTTSTPSFPSTTSYGPKGRILFCLQAAGGESRLRLYDWDEDRYEDIPIRMGALHSVLQDPANPSTIYMFELLGSVGKIDWKTRSFTKIDHREAKRMFNGHGALTRSGEYLATTEIDESQRCFVGLRSVKDLSLVSILPKECNNAHQVIALPNSSLLAVGVMRADDGKTETGAITFYDTESRTIVDRFDFDQPILHLLPLSPTEVVGVSLRSSIGRESKPPISEKNSSSENIATMTKGMAFEPSPLFYASLEGKKKILWSQAEKDVFLYNFGLAKISSNKFLSGHHDSGKVVVWENFEMKKIVDVPKASNLVVSRDGTEFLALSGTKPVAHSLSTFEVTKRFDEWPDVVAFSSYQGS